MGAGIVQIGLTAGLRVVLHDLSAEAMIKAAVDIHARIARLEEKGQLADGFAEDAKGRLLLAGELSAFAPCEAVIEAVSGSTSSSSCSPTLRPWWPRKPCSPPTPPRSRLPHSRPDAGTRSVSAVCISSTPSR
jgi:hypothetical protein